MLSKILGFGIRQGASGSFSLVKSFLASWRFVLFVFLFMSYFGSGVMLSIQERSILPLGAEVGRNLFLSSSNVVEKLELYEANNYNVPIIEKKGFFGRINITFQKFKFFSGILSAFFLLYYIWNILFQVLIRYDTSKEFSIAFLSFFIVLGLQFIYDYRNIFDFFLGLTPVRAIILVVKSLVYTFKPDMSPVADVVLNDSVVNQSGY